jgi:hypothetical protein
MLTSFFDGATFGYGVDARQREAAFKAAAYWTGYAYGLWLQTICPPVPR